MISSTGEDHVEENQKDHPEEAATLARVLRLETMESIRETCDAAEAICPDDCWTLPSYKDLLFLDKTIE